MTGYKARSSTILVVEDDQRWQSRLSSIIQKRGYVVDHANSIAEAHALISQGKQYSALTVDILLGKDAQPQGLSLLSALEFLRSAKGTQGETIVISAYEGYEKEAIERGAYAFFNKATFADDEELFLETLDKAVRTGNEKLKVLEDQTRKFLFGKDVEFLVPWGIINPWSKKNVES